MTNINSSTANQISAGAIVVTRFRGSNDADGSHHQTTWSALRAEIAANPEESKTKVGKCLIFARFNPDPADGQIHRKKALVRDVCALAIDIDDAPEDDVMSAVGALAVRGLEFTGWPTFTQLAEPKAGSLRCRLVLPLSRSVPGKEWGAFWNAAIDFIGLRHVADLQCKDPGRLFYHTCPLGKADEFAEWCQLLTNEGAALDVDAILATVPAARTKASSGTLEGQVDLNAPELLDSGVKVEPCPRGTNPLAHAEHLATTMPAAVSGSGGHVALLRLARALRWGLDLEDAQSEDIIQKFYNPRCEPAWTESEIAHKVDAAGSDDGSRYERGALLPPSEPEPFDAKLQTNEDGAVLATTGNVATILGLHPEWNGVLRFDLLGNRVLCTREPPMRQHDVPNGTAIGAWTDSHSARARTWIAWKYGFEPSKDALEAAVEIAARRDCFHPVQEYLFDLEWDGVPRLDAMLGRYFGAADNQYTRAVGSKFMISAVARAVKPGCKVDTLLILEGPQGTRKSTAVRVLAGDAWFADTPLDLESKDAAQCLQGKWIYEIGELASFNRSETNRIKAFMSSPSDNLRPSYGRRNQDFPRQCVFVGTTNGAEYLSDTTGNRRYWPVKCGVINVAALACDRDQLWAEAVVRQAEGEKWWLDSAAEELASDEQGERQSEDPWESKLKDWAGAKDQAHGFTMPQALHALGVQLEHQSQAQATRAGKLLAKLGYEGARKRSGAKTEGADGTKIVRLYLPVTRDTRVAP